MVLEGDAPALLGFLLALSRAAGWVLVTPPFSSRAVPGAVRGTIALALALPVGSRVRYAGELPGTAGLLAAVAVQVFVGALLGFVVYLVFAAVQAAGDLLDLFGGIAMASAFDPLSLSNTSVLGRMHQFLATVLLFAVDGHLLVVRGFLTSYEFLPPGRLPPMNEVAAALVSDVGTFFVSALQIAAPLIGVLFLADIGLGLLTRIAPALNIFSISFPAKILLTVGLVGLTFSLLPEVVERLTEIAVQGMGRVMRA